MRWEIQQRYGETPDEAGRICVSIGKQRGVDWLWTSGLHHRRPAPSGDVKRVAKRLFEGGSLKMYHIADRLETVMWETKDVPESRRGFGGLHHNVGVPTEMFRSAVCHRPRYRLGGAR